MHRGRLSPRVTWYQRNGGRAAFLTIALSTLARITITDRLPARTMRAKGFSRNEDVNPRARARALRLLVRELRRLPRRCRRVSAAFMHLHGEISGTVIEQVRKEYTPMKRGSRY